MFKKILESFYSKETYTINKLSKDLNISEDTLIEYINELIRMGYMKKDSNITNCNKSTCTNCPFLSGCNINFIQFYSITKKGENYLNKPPV